MSKENTNSVVKSLSKLAIVRRAMAFLNLGEEGKLESFYGKVIYTLNKEKKIINQNIAQAKFNHESDLETFDENLKDAQDAFEHAKIDVDPSKIATNADQTAYVDAFLNNLDSKALAVKKIEKQIESAKESYEKAIKEYNEEIESLDKRIDFLSLESEE